VQAEVKIEFMNDWTLEILFQHKDVTLPLSIRFKIVILTFLTKRSGNTICFCLVC